jgi:PTH1 family peptidyl-tRNA hydrolase
LENLHLIIGLGNPGSKYDNTRHNVGFETIDVISEKYGIKVTKLKHKALVGDGIIEGQRVLLVKPQTFMNLSGESVRDVAGWYKVSPANIIIIYDDIDIPIGKIRVRPKGSSGTHNGMKSVIYQLQSDEFPRVRIGIGKPPEEWDLADYVLSKFSGDELKIIEASISKAAEAVISIIKHGPDAAMNLYNNLTGGTGDHG